MYAGQGYSGRLGGRASAASSTDSLDAILAQFEVVQTTNAPSEPQRQGQNLLNSLLQRSPLLRFHGRPPRPESNVTSHPYQSRRREGREESCTNEQGYQSQTLVPVDPDPAQPSAVVFSSYRHTSLDAEAVNLTENSPAVASSPHQLGTQLRMSAVDVEERLRPAGMVSERQYSTSRRSLSLESLDSMPSSRSSSPPEGGVVRWGQPPRNDLFPLGIPLPLLYRPSSNAIFESSGQDAALQEPVGVDASTSQRFDGESSSAVSAHEQHQDIPDAQQEGSADEETMPSKEPFSPAEMSSKPGAVAAAAVGGITSPFLLASQQPAPESSDSLESCSPKSEPTSASDYGFNTRDASESESGREGFSGKPGERFQASIPTPRKGPSTQRPYRVQSPYHSTTGYHDPSSFGPQLRKRDFESELLERLLSTGLKGSYPSQMARPCTQEHRGLWRAMGLPKSAFVTIVFLCLALFLLVFSAGRIHAQRVMRHQATAVRGAASSQLPSAADQPLPDTSVEGGKHRHSASANLTHTHAHQNVTASLAESGSEETRKHERRPFLGQEIDAVPARHKVGLRLLQHSDARALAIPYFPSAVHMPAA